MYLFLAAKLKKKRKIYYQKPQKKRFAILENRKKSKEKMIEKRKNEHNGRGKLCVKPTKYQRIAFLEHKNFIFRKIICNFAGV